MNKPYKIIDRLELPHTKVELRDDGIIQFFYGANKEYTMEETHELEEAVKALTKGITHMSLRIAGEYTSVNTEVMKYLSRGRGTLFTLADAFVIHSLSQKILANFYLHINRPILPTRVFNKVEEAEAWLQSLDKEDLARRHKLKILQFEK
ncbi:MAG TPA: hypothetical protein VNZ49_10050 [Bacteroidia bacterium]|jgi:hypothetical protein|nr:hypothetical protein [Bacteroidia bacterium]